MANKFFIKMIIGIFTISFVNIIPSYAAYNLYDVNYNILSKKYKIYEDYPNNKLYLLNENEKYEYNKWIRVYSYDDNHKIILRDSWYYFGFDGAAVTGWNEIDNKLYYFEENNKLDTYALMYKNCRKSDFYLGLDGGAVKNSWSKSNDNNWYYSGDDGKILKNTITPDGYKVDNEGKWIK